MAQTSRSSPAIGGAVPTQCIERAKELADRSNEERMSTLEETSALSRSAMWEMRHPMEIGEIFEGMELGGVLESLAATFSTISSIPADLVQSGVEPPLPTATRGALFSIAFNALTNALRHSNASHVSVGLDFERDGLRISISDDGTGLPEDYATRGQGFRNMREEAERLGGRLVVETSGSEWRTAVTCVLPYQAYESEGTEMPSTPVRVLLVDDHPVMRDGLQQLLERTGEFEVVGHAGDGEEAERMAKEVVPDLIIMDVLMPGRDGIEACREIIDALEDVRVLMLTASTEKDAVIEAVAAGADGYLQKFTGTEQLLAMVRDVAGGEYRMPRDVMRRVFRRLRHLPEEIDSPRRKALTSREKEILTQFAKGMSYSAIAESRGNRSSTVRNTIYHI